jgi:hypothetical protein
MFPLFVLYFYILYFLNFRLRFRVRFLMFCFFLFFLHLSTYHFNLNMLIPKLACPSAHSFAYTHILTLLLTSLLSFIITMMADIKILSLRFDSESIISYPPSIIMKQSQPSSTTPTIPIPDLFAATSVNIGNIRPCPEPYPPAAHWSRPDLGAESRLLLDVTGSAGLVSATRREQMGMQTSKVILYLHTRVCIYKVM